MTRSVQRFEVSLKAFIVLNGAALLMREADTGWWELPGGRIDVGEEWHAHAAILEREIAEELGSEVRLRVADRATTWVRRRPTDGMHLFIVARPAQLIRGMPRLSDEHSEMAWIEPNAWQSLIFPPESGYRQAIPELWRLVADL